MVCGSSAPISFGNFHISNSNETQRMHLNTACTFVMAPKNIYFSHFTLQFDGFIDLDSYDTIALKLKGDGRCYISTVSFVSFPLLREFR